MKFPIRFLLTGAAVLAAASPLTTSAQNRTASAAAAAPARPAASASNKVGLVDVGHIFTNYEKLKASRDALQKEMEASDGQLKQYQEEIAAIQEQLKGGTVAKGSDQWTALEKQFTEINAKGQAEMSNLRRDFIRKEVQMYKDIYDEVAFTVGQYAKARQYSLILRYQRETPEEESGIEDPNKIMSRVNQLVVYHQDTDDITNEILAYMNSQYQKTAARPAAPAAPAAPARN